MRTLLVVISLSVSIGGLYGADRPSSPATATGPRSDPPRFELIIKEAKGLPITTLNLTFRVGSADDPAGREGVVNLTARLLREGGVKAWQGLPERNRLELENALLPFAADIGVTVGKEQTSLTVTTPADDSIAVFNLLSQMVVAPAFNAADLNRIRAEQQDYLTKRAPAEDEEELGKFALNQFIFGPNHPYSHSEVGRLTTVKTLTLDDVQAAYRSLFVQRRLTVGIGGQIGKELLDRINSAFTSLPVGEAANKTPIPAPPAGEKIQLLVVKGKFEATGIHLGQPLAFNRSGDEFPSMLLANLAFGKHRSFVGRLMKQVREIRGLNYGTYSYIEDFPHGGKLMVPPTQVSRQRQAFTVWGRPTTLKNGCFLMRQLYREVSRLQENGLTQKEFELTQSHAVGYLPILGSALSDQVGYAIDSRFYGISDQFLLRATEEIRKVGRDNVNELIKKTLRPLTMSIVVVTPDPDQFIGELFGFECPIIYSEGVSQPAEILQEDKEISTFKLPVERDSVTVIEADRLFE